MSKENNEKHANGPPRRGTKHEPQFVSRQTCPKISVQICTAWCQYLWRVKGKFGEVRGRRKFANGGLGPV